MQLTTHYKHLKIWSLRLNNKIKLIVEGIIFVFFAIFLVLEIINQYTKINITYNHAAVSLIMLVLATWLVFYWEFDYFKLYYQLKTFDFSMDLLIAIATHLTYFFSIVMSIIKIIQDHSLNNLSMEFYEVGYSLSFFIGIGHLVEDNLKVKSSLGIKDLLKLQNKNALIQGKDKNFYEQKSEIIQKGDVIKIMQGASIPTDGKLISNTAYLDYSSLLGENIPRTIKKNQEVLSGAIVLDNYIIYQATKTMQESSLAKIIQQLENILKNKSKLERISQKIVKWFLPTTVILALFTFVLWMVLNFNNIKIPIDLPWETYTKDDALGKIKVALFNMMGVLIIACPCAFGIATPAAIYSSSFVASKNKILFTNSQTYETLNNITFVAFDKTGTLTNGKPTVIEEVNTNSYHSIIFELVKHSSHPLSNAIKNYLQGKTKNKIKLQEIKEIPGIGISCKYKNNEYFIGSLKYIKKNIKFKNQQFNEHYSYVFFAKNKELIAYFKISDQLKTNAKEIINKLHEQKIKTIILSGDHHEIVNHIAHELKIDYAFGDLLPIEKANKINQYKQQGKIVFVGDGINDILAIKSATVGMAFSSGSEITNSIADISLLSNDLSLVYKAIYLSKKTIALIKLNYFWAGIFNFICVPLAMIGIIPLWLGVILMTLSTIVLLTNTLLYKRSNTKALAKIY